MIAPYEISLASVMDARRIAKLSREAVEHGLSWSWTGVRVLRSLRDPSTNVVVARREERLLGFGIMKYREDEAHLLLLAVDAPVRNTGIGSALLQWLDLTVQAAGLSCIKLETRARNESARAFYRSQGYAETEVQHGYYEGVEDAVRMTKPMRTMAVT